jgi:hypothetical protein
VDKLKLSGLGSPHQSKDGNKICEHTKMHLGALDMVGKKHKQFSPEN